MKHYAKPPAATVEPPPIPESAQGVPFISDVSVQRLIDDCLTVLYREVKQLMLLSVKGKLGPNEARDLRDNLKLLFELKEREKESLKGLTDEQLKAMVDDGNSK